MVRHLQFPRRDEEGRRTYCTSFSPSEDSTCCVPKVDLALKRLSHDVYPCANEYRQTNKHLRARDYHVDHQDVRVLVGHNWTPRPNDCKSKGGNYSRWHNCSPSTGNMSNRGGKYLMRKFFCAKKILPSFTVTELSFFPFTVHYRYWIFRKINYRPTPIYKYFWHTNWVFFSTDFALGLIKVKCK